MTESVISPSKQSHRTVRLTRRSSFSVTGSKIINKNSPFIGLFFLELLTGLEPVTSSLPKPLYRYNIFLNS